MRPTRSMLLRLGLTAGVAVSIAAFFEFGPRTGPADGRTRGSDLSSDRRIEVPAAGISFVVPPGWSVRTPEGSGDVVTVGLDGDPSVGMSVSTNDDPVHSAADLRAMAFVSAHAKRDFVQIFGADIGPGRAPVVPSVRVREEIGVCLFLCENAGTVAYWLMVDGRSVVIFYVDGSRGEADPPALTADPGALAGVVASLRLLPGHHDGSHDGRPGE